MSRQPRMAIAATIALALALAGFTSPSFAVPVAQPVATATISQAKIDSAVQHILAKTNAKRKAKGLKPLILDSRITAVAQKWSNTLAARAGGLTHNPQYAAAMPSGWTRAGENVAAGQSVAEVVKEWMESAGHRENILGDYTHIGIGYAVTSGGYGTYFTQDFAKYASTKAKVSKPTKLTVGKVKTKSVRVSWAKPKTVVGTIVKYTVTIKGKGLKRSYVTKKRAISLTKLKPHRTYTVTVKATVKGGGHTATSPVAKVKFRTR